MFDPKHFDALHLLGIISSQLGRPEAAVEVLAMAIAQNGRSAECQFSMAAALYALGRMSEAAAHFTRAIALKPGYFAAHVNLGNILFLDGRLAEARAQYERALALDPRSALTLMNLGNVLLQEGKPQEAAAMYRRALASQPNYVDACTNLGIALAAQGQWEEAAAQYRRAIALAPAASEAHISLGEIALAQGDLAQALSCARRALAIKESNQAKAFFTRSAKHLRVFPAEDHFRNMVGRAMSEGWCRPSDLSPVAAELFKLSEAGRAVVERVAAAWPARPPAKDLWSPSELAAVSKDRGLCALLESAPVRDVAIERFLTTARAVLLDAALATDGPGVSEEALGFFAALAQQCFINEYVFADTEEETRKVTQLREALSAALAAAAAIPTLRPIAVAAYMPLHKVAGAQTLLERRWPDAVARVLDRQVKEPLAERELRQSMPRLTSVRDEVSLLVQGQYEEMPYPRWIKAAPAVKPATIDQYLRNRFPQVPFRPLGKREIEVLVAGCGTGRYLIEIANGLLGPKILGVDLSLTSLGYAKRMAQSLGLANIEFAQADILELGSIGRSFDVIDASGVLHHLRDPAAGWRVLVSLLQPGGVMHVGLYSALARVNVRAARTFIAQRGYGQSAEAIRQCRQEIMSATGGAPLQIVASYADFFTTSECRDLLFHVQEHQLTIPEIKQFLADNKLTFRGFVTEAARDYRQKFPEDPAMTDLDHWQQFESENPDIFIDMYEFWIQKPV